ncbi:MAG: hypothetical protein AAGK37_03740 [Pseudomonadota bacterium]
MSAAAIKNAMVWDGTADSGVPATIVVSGNEIAKVIPAGEAVGELPPDTIDGTGHTLMPGMAEFHWNQRTP